MLGHIHPLLKSIDAVLRVIADFFGQNCEIALYSTNKEAGSLISKYNFNDTNRNLEDTVEKVEVDLLDFKEALTTYNSTKDGRTIKVSIIPIIDEDTSLIGYIEINYDITELTVAKTVIDSLCSISNNKLVPDEKDEYSVNEVLHNIVDKVLEQVGKPVVYLNKDDKVDIVKILNAQGVFLIKGALDYIADRLCVSKYTIYNYLEEIKN